MKEHIDFLMEEEKRFFKISLVMCHRRDMIFQSPKNSSSIGKWTAISRRCKLKFLESTLLVVVEADTSFAFLFPFLAYSVITP